MKVTIYIHHTFSSPKASNGSYIYILESVINDKPVTLTKSGKLKESKYKAELLIILEALGRIRKDCTVEIVGVDNYFKNIIDKIDAYKEAGWTNAKGKELSNLEEWKKIYELAKKYQITTKLDEGHSYRKWMVEEVKRNG